jgi:hypothetical protein
MEEHAEAVKYFKRTLWQNLRILSCDAISEMRGRWGLGALD